MSKIILSSVQPLAYSSNTKKNKFFLVICENLLWTQAETDSTQQEYIYQYTVIVAWKIYAKKLQRIYKLYVNLLPIFLQKQDGKLYCIITTSPSKVQV